MIKSDYKKMTPEQIITVRENFDAVKALGADAADFFYARLFVLDPTLRSLFKGDMKKQGEKLLLMIEAAVESLDDLEKLAPILRELGARHHSYGVQDSHYDTVGSALLTTLAQGLGPSFTQEARRAWLTAYGVISSAMLEGSARSPEPDTR